MPLTLRYIPLALFTCLALTLPCRAQTSPRDDLLALVPPDVGLCVIVNDLRGHAQKWEQLPWMRSLRQTALVKTILDMPEARQIAGLEAEWKKNLGIDWPTLRDEILGDSVVLAYRPGTPAHPEQEQGMIALRAAKPQRLADLVDRFNQLQKDRGELKEIQPVKHLGVTYYRRVHALNSHYYYLDGSLLVVAGSEAMLRDVIARELGKAKDASPWPARFARAGAAKSIVALGINPQAFDLFPPPAKNGKTTGFGGLWRALDGVFVTLRADTDIELRISLQGRAADMPEWAQHLFKETPPPSVLWQRFPEPAVLTVATRTDFVNLVKQIREAIPPQSRKQPGVDQTLAEVFKLVTGLDLFEDIVPNLGPDWGVCVVAPKARTDVPQIIAAIAIKQSKEGPRNEAAIFVGLQTLAGLFIANYNRDNPDDPIRIETIKQGNVTVKVLRQDKLFPSGLRPACAIKDGFLLIASSPDAIALFGAHDPPAPSKTETPLVRLSPVELAQLLRQRRTQILARMQDKQQLSKEDAERNFDQLLGVLEIFESVTLSQRSEPGQATWNLRITPRNR
jgi:hypothetical protein